MSEDSFRTVVPQISLPRGGGAIRGMGEKFAANPVTGTCEVSVPLAVSSGRGGFGPQLSVSYDSGSGNGPFGIGWRLALPTITRKTDKGLPRYEDRLDSDTFILSGAEDLVPVFRQEDGAWVLDEHGNPRAHEDTLERNGERYSVRRYRPRVEGLFALIEQWTHQSNAANVFWRSISRENVTTWYGLTRDSRIADPEDEARIYSWLICESDDDKGNVIAYDYAPEDDVNVDMQRSNERHRIRTANRYLTGVRYGNTPSRLAPEFADGVTWHFEVRLDYGQGRNGDDYRDEPPAADGSRRAVVRKNPAAARTWPARLDAFSNYRAGFEVRTHRLCHRVLMFHRFDELLGAEAQLVRSTEIEYDENPIATRVKAIRHCAFLPASENATERRYRKRSLPPVTFGYSAANIDSQVREIDAGSLENLPAGLAGSGCEWVDLEGEGLPGILTEQAQGWFYKRNLGPVNLQQDSLGVLRAHAKFSSVELVAPRPLVGIENGAAQFMDLAGDGQPDLVLLDSPTPGFYEYGDSGWISFRAFVDRLGRSVRDPNLRFVDLDGDGRADVLITEDEVLTWHPSLGEEGFGAGKQVRKEHDEEAGPALILADGTQSIYVADMSGDGLADLVRIRNGEVCYWPNLGYGTFGAKVTMDDAPWFDAPDRFDQARIRLADIDGSAVTDLIYFGAHGPQLYFNQSGNRWSARQDLPDFPPISEPGAIAVADLLGNGTACLVWSSSMPGDSRPSMKYVDLMGGTKPHLLVEVRNNLGATTTIEYQPSTRFYLEDKLAGRPWVTRLPFPVHCVTKVSVFDRWRRTTFASTYSYHHGYFDGVEREFRGFGRVEQIDTEDYRTFVKGNAASPWITRDLTLYQPPVKTITWYHTGAALGRDRIVSQFRDEYFPRSLAARPAQIKIDAVFSEKTLPEPDLEDAELSADEWREAMRACKGGVLRQEVYELDVDALVPSGGTPSRQLPVKLFSAAEHNCVVRRLQPRGSNRHAVFQVMESEAVTYHYEQDLTVAQPLKPDPRIAHALNLSFDVLGNVQQAVAVGYARVRQFDDPALAAQRDLIRELQRDLHVAYSETRYTNDAVDKIVGTAPSANHRLRIPCESLTYELSGVAPAAGRYFSVDELRNWKLSDVYPTTVPGKDMATRAYHEVPQTAAATRRLVEHTRTLFFNDDAAGPGPGPAPGFLQAPLKLGKLGVHGLVFEHYKLALTDSLLDAVFTDGQLDNVVHGGMLVRARLRNPETSGYTNGERFFDNPPADAAHEYWMRSGVAGFAADAAHRFFLPERYTDVFGSTTSVAYDDKYDLFIRSSTDALGNIASCEKFDYRVLAVVEQRDANANHSAVALDIFGMAVATAAIGKLPGESGDTLIGVDPDIPAAEVSAFLQAAYREDEPAAWLASATTRYVYTFGDGVDANGVREYEQHPPAACGIVRTTHVASGVVGEIQVSVEYSDAMGNVLVRKSQAEPDPEPGADNVTLRWIANGKTVFNNKGKPVKQYEPYFSRTQHSFDEVEATDEFGVTPILYYDSVGRLVRTEFPDGSFSRVEFSPWHTRSFDANDTVGEPGNAWYASNAAANATAQRRRAASLALAHAGTPATTMLDSLGRDVVSIAHNRVEDAQGPLDIEGRTYRDEYYATFTKLDAESKPLWIRDARGNLTMQYLWPPKPDRDVPRAARDFSPNGNPNNDVGNRVPTYDIAGNLLFSHSMDAGNRWSINDGAGRPMCAWDRNDRQDEAVGFTNEQRLTCSEYDTLHRPTNVWLQINGAAEANVERFEYEDTNAADGTPNPNFAALQAANLIGQQVRHYDTSGLSETARRDFKGNVLEAARTLNNRPKASVIDWRGANPNAQLANETFREITEYDALNRMTLQYAWHRDAVGGPAAKYEPRYNRRGLLEAETLTIRLRKTAAGFEQRPDTKVTPAVREIRYDVKGRKTLLVPGNDTLTHYGYDETTFRLRQLRTTRLRGADGDPAFPAFSSNLSDARVLQQLQYTYDPSGNLTEIFDEAYEPVFFQNQLVEARGRYEYDALYRLIRSNGRENGAFAGAPSLPESAAVDAQFPIASGAPNALRNYTQTFEYDAVGNIDRIRHDAGRGTWIQRFHHADDSNRLIASWDTNDDWEGVDPSIVTSHAFDAHGNMRNLLRSDPRFNLRWDERDLLRFIDLGGGGTVHYQYDSGKERTRKRIYHQNGLGDYWERLYLGGYELYRRYDLAGTRVVEEIESRHLFCGEQRVLLVDDVRVANRVHADGTAFATQPVFRYQYSNHLGSACVELDDRAEIISYEEYHPYGTCAYRAIARGIEAPAKRYRYTGMERDEESGLNYHSARYMACHLARWLSYDELPREISRSRYASVGGNPIRMTDRNGLQEEEEEPKGFEYWLGELISPGSQDMKREVDKRDRAMLRAIDAEYAKGNTGPESEARLQAAIDARTLSIKQALLPVAITGMMATNQALEHMADSMMRPVTYQPPFNESTQAEIQIAMVQRRMVAQPNLNAGVKLPPLATPPLASITPPVAAPASAAPVPAAPVPAAPVASAPAAAVSKFEPVAHSGSPTGAVIKKLDPVKLTEKQQMERGGLSGMVSRNESLDPSRTEGFTTDVPLPEGTSVRSWRTQGREYRQEVLQTFAHDENQPAYIRGWFANEQRRMDRTGAQTMRTPPGFVLGHLPGKRASEGFDYTNSTLVTEDINALEMAAWPKFLKGLWTQKNACGPVK